MSFIIKHNVPTKKLFEEWEISEFKGQFQIQISKTDVFNLSFRFKIYYDCSNGFYCNDNIKESIIFSYEDKENTYNILEDLCSGNYEYELKKIFKEHWIDGITINDIIDSVIRQLKFF